MEDCDWLLASRPVNVSVTVCAETAANSSIMVIKSKCFFIAMKLGRKGTKKHFCPNDNLFTFATNFDNP